MPKPSVKYVIVYVKGDTFSFYAGSTPFFFTWYSCEEYYEHIKDICVYQEVEYAKIELSSLLAIYASVKDCIKLLPFHDALAIGHLL